MGKWISTDKNDTLNFVDNNNFYKNGTTLTIDWMVI